MSKRDMLIANREMDRLRARVAKLEDRIAILEAELRVAYALPDAINSAFDAEGNCQPQRTRDTRRRPWARGDGPARRSGQALAKKEERE